MNLGWPHVFAPETLATCRVSGRRHAGRRVVSRGGQQCGEAIARLEKLTCETRDIQADAHCRIAVEFGEQPIDELQHDRHL